MVERDRTKKGWEKMSADDLLFASTLADDANANRQHIVRRRKLGFHEALGGLRWLSPRRWWWLLSSGGGGTNTGRRQLSSICDEVVAAAARRSPAIMSEVEEAATAESILLLLQ